MTKKTTKKTIKESDKEEEVSPEELKKREWYSKRLASRATLNKIQDGYNIPRMEGQIMERGLYEGLGIIWASPNPNRAERRKYGEE